WPGNDESEPDEPGRQEEYRRPTVALVRRAFSRPLLTKLRKFGYGRHRSPPKMTGPSPEGGHGSFQLLVDLRRCASIPGSLLRDRVEGCVRFLRGLDPACGCGTAYSMIDGSISFMSTPPQKVIRIAVTGIFGYGSVHLRALDPLITAGDVYLAAVSAQR